jgi:hypothetical protein
MKFFLDNNLSPKIAKALNNLVWPGHQVVHLKEKFSADISDQEWMRKLAEEDERWIIITADIHISRNQHEVRAWKQCGHTIFFLKPAWIMGANFWSQAQKLVHYFPDIITLATSAKQGDAFFVPISGKIRQD